MKKILATLFIACIFPYTASLAAKCPAGQYNDNALGCTDCPENHYCREDNKTKCPDSHHLSPKKSADINACYTECKQEDIDNGTKKPINTTASYNNGCSFTIQCDNTNDKCSGYHEYNDKCISNQQSCTKHLTLKGTFEGLKFWNNSTSEYSECFITNCGDDRHLENLGNICGIQYGRDCAANRGDCENKLGNCDNGTITGQYSWVNQYRYDDCICTKLSSDNNGTYSSSCKRTANEGTNTQWGNCETTAIKCNAGLCAKENNLAACTPADAGYYHSNEQNARCEKCPMGSTSKPGTTTIADCFIQSNGGKTYSSAEECVKENATCFCDDYGCFTLPGTDKINYSSGS